MHFEYGKINWDDVRLFLAVANCGGLSAAVPETGLSAPTLNRRMAEFEKTLSMQLFVRGAKGYALTRTGQKLFERVQPITEQMRAIVALRESLDPRPRVRISCGYWTGVYIARNLMSLQAEVKEFARLEILSGTRFLNLSRREADLAVRNVMPDQQGLARRRIGRVDFALYASHEYLAEHPNIKEIQDTKTKDWMVLAASAATGASARWLQQHLECPASTTFDTPHAVIEAAAAGGGLCVLPCFVGESEKRLQRCSSAIEGLGHTQWLVSHEVSRWERPVKKVSDAIFAMFKRDLSLFEAPDNV